MSYSKTEAAKDKARQEVTKLVAEYQSLPPTSIKKYTEADTRREFIEPLFGALGWDVYSREEVAEEVKAAAGRVDYVFKLHGISQFYLEAKALRAELTKPEYIKQAITYAYNKGITWAVLTDFEGLQLYNAQTGRLFINLSCDNYLADFDDLWLLSRQSLETNALNERAEKYGALPPRLGVEQRLYNQLRQWREQLYSQIYHHNQDLNLNYSQIDEVIQRLFNRLIFIRTCEDRGIEDRVLLGAVHEWQGSGRKGELIETLQRIFRDFDGYYDSDLFAHHLTDQVFIDGVTVEAIINGLYEIPSGMASYDFSLIDADVLGAVYEQYLGHVATEVKQQAEKAQIRMDLGFPSEPTFELTAKKQRRKEHGIYYTPRFITDYIVKQTVGRFLRERSHNEIINIKVLDPACGSGSFLIRAYDELLNYHAYQRGKPVSQLDQWERLPILIGNIFGVDLDMQAIEIARLNLLLRSLAKRDTLPSLADNIRQGNSLISGTEDELKRYFGDSWREKKPFNWEQEVADTMARGGFDVVIGNPPYVRVDSLPDDEKTLWKDRFESAVGKYDLYYLFLELAFRLVNERGVFAFITPNRYCTNTTGECLRKLMLSEGKRVAVISLSRLPVFEEVANYPVITIVHKAPKVGIKKLSYFDVTSLEELHSMSPSYELSENELKLLPRAIIPINVDDQKLKIALRLLEGASPAGQFVRIHEGLRIPTSWESKKLGAKGQTPIIKQFQFSRYSNIEEASYLAEKQVDSLLSSGAERIANCRKPKLVFVEDALRIEATIDKSKGLCQGGVYFATSREPNVSLYYLLALFNSKLLTFIFKCLYSGIHMGGGFLRFRTQYLQELPIRRIDFDNPSEKKAHDDLVTLVDKMLELNKRLAPMRNTPCNDRDELLHQIEQTDREIDNLVYDLYGLTEEEKRVIKGATNPANFG